MDSAASIQAGQAYIVFFADSSKLSASLKNASSLLQNFASTSVSLFQSMMGAHYTFKNIVQPLINLYGDFDDQMRLTKAVTGATDEQFAMLTGRAKQLGRDTAFTASQVASAMVALGRMGFSPEQIDSSISSVMDLSRATGTDLARSADIAANTLRIFGLEATQMSHVADILTVAANGSAQTLPDLFEALKMTGPQAAVAKESLTDVAAAIGVMANVGVKGSMAGTALRRAYTQMADGKIQGILKQYNIETVDSNKNLRKMKDIIVDVARAMQNMGSAEKMSFAEQVFGLRGAQVALTLGGNVDEMQRFIAMLDNAEGEAARKSAAMEAGMGGAIRLMKSALEGLAIAIGETINDFVIFGSSFITNIVRNIINFINAVPVVSRVMVAVGAAVLPAVAGLVALAFTMKGVALVSGLCGVAINGMSAALTMLLAHPIFAGLALLTAAIVFHTARLRTMSAEIKKAADQQSRLNRELEEQRRHNTREEAGAQVAGEQFQRLAELAELSRQQKLSNGELLEADRLIQQLAPYGSAYFAQLDAVAGSLTMAADAQRQFNAAANAAQLPGLEAERDKLLAMVEAIKAERDAVIKRRGVKSVMRNQVTEEQAQVKIDALQPQIDDLQARIDKLKEPIPLDIRAPEALPPSIADIEKAAKTLDDLDAKINAAGMTDEQRRVEELNRQNELYREQIELLRGVQAAKADSIRADIAMTEAQKETAYEGTEEQRAAEIADVGAQLEKATANAEERRYDVELWRNWEKQGNELFDAGKMEHDMQALFFAEAKVEGLAARLKELNASKTTAEIELQIKQKQAALGEVDQEMESLQSRLSEYEEKANAQREKIQREKAGKIMSDIEESDRRRQQESEEQAWRQGMDKVFAAGNMSAAIAQGTEALNAERENETQIRGELDRALEDNDPESMRLLSEDLKRSIGRQDYIQQGIDKAEKAQKDSESAIKDTAQANLGSFFTADVLNLLGGGGPEEETARNTRATAANLATLIDVVRRNEGLMFS